MLAKAEGHNAFFCAGSKERRDALEKQGIVGIDQKQFNRFAGKDDVKAFNKTITASAIQLAAVAPSADVVITQSSTPTVYNGNNAVFTVTMPPTEWPPGAAPCPCSS